MNNTYPMHAVANYLTELNAAIGAAWNRFWFTPSSARLPAILRIATGLLALYSIATYGADLNIWFGEEGMLPQALMNELYRRPDQWLSLRSLLDYLPDSAIWPFYWASLAVIALFTVGIGGRITAIASTVAVISFFARAPVLTGEFESVLVMLLVYLCIARTSDALSISRLLKKHAATPTTAPSPIPHSAFPISHSPFNTISIRLIQLHIALIHLMMGYAQLAAPENAWWSGEGVWLAAARPGMSLVDLSSLADHPRLVAAWSHAITIYLLAFPVLVWKPLARPLLLAIGGLVWLCFAIASGWIMFCLAMLTGIAAFFGRSSFPASATVAR